MTQAQPRPAAGAIVADPLLGSKYRVLREVANGGWGVVYEAAPRRSRPALRGEGAPPGVRPRSRGAGAAPRRGAGARPPPVAPHRGGVGLRTHRGRAPVLRHAPLLVAHTLAEELRQRGFLPPEEAIALVQQLLAGLDVAHRAGLVHRDVKLDNLFLCDEDGGPRVLKILDFGDHQGAARCRGQRSLRDCGRKRGKWSARRASCRPSRRWVGRSARPPTSTAWASCSTSCSRAAIRSSTCRASRRCSRRTCHEDAPAPSTVAPQPIEPVLDDVVMRALAKRPEDRYASAAELSAALARALTWTHSVAPQRHTARATRSARCGGGVGTSTATPGSAASWSDPPRRVLARACERCAVCTDRGGAPPGAVRDGTLYDRT